MLPIDVPATLTALAAVIAAFGALFAAWHSSRNASTLKRVESSVNGDLKRLADHLLEARREVAEAEERLAQEQRRKEARSSRSKQTRRPPVPG